MLIGVLFFSVACVYAVNYTFFFSEMQRRMRCHGEQSLQEHTQGAAIRPRHISVSTDEKRCRTCTPHLSLK